MFYHILKLFQIFINLLKEIEIDEVLDKSGIKHELETENIEENISQEGGEHPYAEQKRSALHGLPAISD